jgi:hypothetical protein
LAFEKIELHKARGVIFDKSYQSVKKLNSFIEKCKEVKGFDDIKDDP